jgi:hypothetical protein
MLPDFLAVSDGETAPSEALESWWDSTVGRAVNLFHTPGIRAPERREFFAQHVYNEAPTLVVSGDAFLVSEPFALAVARALAEVGDGDDAVRWLSRAEQTPAVLRCRERLATAPDRRAESE